MSTDRTPEERTPQAIAADIAREFRADHSRWRPFAWAHRANGTRCITPFDAQAVCWCLRGAIDKRLAIDDFEASKPVYEAFEHALGLVWSDDDKMGFVAWNDTPGRTVEEVIALCDKVAAS